MKSIGTQKHLSNIMLTLVLSISSSQLLSAATDYNGNLIGKNKVIFNNNSSNSYIQSLTSHTINFDGLLDQPFGNNSVGPLGTTFVPAVIATGSTSDICYSIAIQSDGKIVMGGVSNNRFAAARFLPNGQLDVSFGGPAAGYSSQAGTMFIATFIAGGTHDECKSVAIQPDGKIVMGGYSNVHFAAARLLSNGALDTSFGGLAAGYTSQSGTLFLPFIAGGTQDVCWSIAIQPDGKIVMGGYTSPTYAEFAAARLLPNGALDTSFGNHTPTNGTMFIATNITPGGTEDVCRSIALQANGNIVMGGWSHAGGGNWHFAAARLLSNGNLDSSFGGYNSQPGTMYIAPIAGGAEDKCNSIALQADGKIVMGGYSVEGITYARFAAARLLLNGQLDSSFGGYNSQAGTMYITPTIAGGILDLCYSIAIQLDGKIVMSGYSADGVAHSHFSAARLLLNGQLDSSFGNNTVGRPVGTMFITPTIAGGGTDDNCNAIAIQPDGKIAMGGYSGTTKLFALARLINPMSLQAYQASYAGVGAGLYS